MRPLQRHQERHPNGLLKAIYKTMGSLKHGVESNYSDKESRRLVCEIPYRYGIIHGVQREYHDNGVLWRLTCYCDGEKHGAIEIYNELGIKTDEAWRIHGWCCSKAEWLHHKQCEEKRAAEAENPVPKQGKESK